MKIYIGQVSDFLKVDISNKTLDVIGINNLGKTNIFDNKYYQVIITEADKNDYNVLLSEEDFETLWDDLGK